MPELDPSVDRELARARRPFVDRDFSFSLLGSLLFHLVFLLASALMPPTASGLSMDMNSDDQRYARYLIERDEEVAPAFLGANQTGEKGEKPAPGEAGKAGTTDASKVPRKRASKGEDKTGLPPKAEPGSVARAGILGVLADSMPKDVGGLFDPEHTGGTDAQVFLGTLYGQEIGASEGLGGLHLRNAGRGGGGDPSGTIGLDRLGTVGDGPGGDGRYGRGVGGFAKRGDGTRPPPTSGPIVIAGGLSKETIRRTIYPHLAEIRFCYERGRRLRPDLAGRVTVGFLIAPSGVVQSAHIASSDIASEETEQCIRDAVRRWSFPQPEGGGMVSVTYPFMLQAVE